MGYASIAMAWSTRSSSKKRYNKGIKTDGLDTVIFYGFWTLISVVDY